MISSVEEIISLPYSRFSSYHSKSSSHHSKYSSYDSNCSSHHLNFSSHHSECSSYYSNFQLHDSKCLLHNPKFSSHDLKSFFDEKNFTSFENFIISDDIFAFTLHGFCFNRIDRKSALFVVFVMREFHSGFFGDFDRTEIVVVNRRKYFGQI